MYLLLLDNTMANRKTIKTTKTNNNKKQTSTKHTELKIGQNETPLKNGMNAGASERQAFPVALVASVVLLELKNPVISHERLR